MNKNKTITYRFMRYLICIIILSNCLTFFCQYFIIQNNMKNQSMEMGKNLMESNLSMIEQYFRDVDNIAYSLIYNRDIVRFLKNDVDRADDLKWLDGVESLYFNSRSDLRLSFYKDGKYNNIYSLLIKRDVSDYRYEKWYQEMLWTGKERILISGTATKNEPDFIHSIIYRIDDLYGNDVVGYLKIDMDLKYLKEIFVHDYSRIAGTSITDEEGKMLFWDKLIIELDDSVYNSREHGVLETEEYLISYGTSENTGWHICMAMSKAELFRNHYKLIPVLFGLLLAILAATARISNRFLNIITVNFKRLSEGMKLVKQGKLHVTIEPEISDEISLLIQEFNEMMQKVNSLMETVEAKQILLKETEIKALQQQINPHFMHNIMETIRGLASEGMDEEVIQMSECMSDMLRYNTRMNDVTTLREEMEQIRNYVQVLKIRFQDRFEVYYDYDEECLDCIIVKFMLQPLVENSLTHGLSETWKDGMLRIRIVREEDLISVMIFDNGVGFSEERLEEMRRQLEITTERPLDYINQYKSLGIMNVHLRLRLYYGEKYSIEIFSKPGRGTCISIKIPYIKENNEDRADV